MSAVPELTDHAELPWTLDPASRFAIHAHTVNVWFRNLLDFQREVGTTLQQELEDVHVIYVPVAVCAEDEPQIGWVEQRVAHQCLEVEAGGTESQQFSLWLHCYERRIHCALQGVCRPVLRNASTWFVDITLQCPSDESVDEWLSEHATRFSTRLEEPRRPYDDEHYNAVDELFCIVGEDVPSSISLDHPIQLTFQLFIIHGVIFSPIVLGNFQEFYRGTPFGAQYGQHGLVDFDNCWVSILDIVFASEHFMVQKSLAISRIPWIGTVLRSGMREDSASTIALDIPGASAIAFGKFLACVIGGQECLEELVDDWSHDVVVAEVVVIADFLGCDNLVKDIIHQLTFRLSSLSFSCMLTLLDRLQQRPKPVQSLCKAYLHTVAKCVFLEVCRQCPPTRFRRLLQKHAITGVMPLRALVHEHSAQLIPLLALSAGVESVVEPSGQTAQAVASSGYLPEQSSAPSDASRRDVIHQAGGSIVGIIQHACQSRRWHSGGPEDAPGMSSMSSGVGSAAFARESEEGAVLQETNNTGSSSARTRGRRRHRRHR